MKMNIQVRSGDGGGYCCYYSTFTTVFTNVRVAMCYVNST